MASVFISWGSADQVVATDLARRLRSLGMDVYFSGIDRHPGNEVTETVLAEIRAASVAVLALSNDSVQRKWVAAEILWCFQQWRDEKSPMKKLVPLIVGELDQVRVPDFIGDVERLDITKPLERESNLQLLLAMIETVVLRGKRSIPVPAALFAMTTSEFNHLCESAMDEDLEGLVALCRSVGLDGAADWRETVRRVFGGRYSELREDYKPFGLALREVFDSAVTQLNRKRLADNQEPVRLEWDTESFLDARRRREDAFVDKWSSSRSLTIVDSLSAFHPVIRDALRDLPPPRDDRRSGMIWVSPFFHQSTDIEGLIRDVARQLVPLQKAFLDWEKREDRSVAFHTGTATAFRQWVYRAVAELANPLDALEPHKSLMDAQFHSDMHPAGFNGGGSR